MAENEEFEQLKKDLESKSNQIENLKTQIEQHKGMISSPDIEKKATMRSVLDDIPHVPFTTNVPTCLNSHVSQGFYGSSATISYKNNPMVATVPSMSPVYNMAQNTTTSGLHVEEVIKNFHFHVEDLQRKLKITTEMCTEQDTKYQESFKEMELKLRRAISSRDELLKLRQAESNNQQNLINHLQLAFDKLETDKFEMQEKVVTLNEKSESLIKDKSMFKKKLEWSDVQLSHIINIMTPDLKKLQLDGIIDITKENIVKFLEKFVSMNREERDQLDYQVKSFATKIEDNKVIYEERMRYEKQLIETHYKEVINNHVINLSAKDKELNNLKVEIKTLNQAFEETEKSHNEKVILISKTTSEDKKKVGATLLMYEQENKDYREKNELLQEELDVCKKEINDLSMNKNNLLQNIQKLNSEIKSMKAELENSSLVNGELKKSVEDLQKHIQTTKTTLESEKIQLQHEIIQKNVQCQELMMQENNLKEKLNALAHDVEKTVKDEEQVKYEKELTEIKGVIDDYKKVLEKAQGDLKSKEEVILKGNNNVTDLNIALRVSNQQIEKLKHHLHGNEDIINAKENKIVSLLFEIDELKSNVEAATRNEVKLIETLKDANQTVESQKEKNMSLEKTNMELLQNIEKCNFKSNFIQQEWDKIVNAMSSKNSEIQTLTKERKAILKKLKGKHDTLQSKMDELKKLSNEFKRFKEVYVNLEKKCDKLEKRCLCAEQDMDKVQTARHVLEAVVEEQEDTQKKEMLKLLQRLKISEQDLVLLKNLLDNEKLSDRKAIKVASITQKVVTKQRSELDSLKTKLQWMKEALDVSETTRHDLELEIVEKVKSIEKQNENLRHLSSQNKQLRLRLRCSQDESGRLQRALEQAAFKYSDVYALVEKQEMVLKNERNSYNAEIQALKDNFFLKSAQNFKSIPSGMNNVNTEAVNVGEHLRHLLQEVKDMLSTTLDDIKYTAANHPHVREGPAQRELPIYESTPHSEHSDMSDTAWGKRDIVIVTPATGENTLKLNEYLEKHSSDAVDISSAIDMTRFMDTKSNAKEKQQHVATSSPKQKSESFSAVEVNFVSDTTLSSISDSVIPLDKVTKKNIGTSSANMDPVSRLQQKLSNLKDMGTNLSSNNKELTEIMKKHSQKLRNLKEKTAEMS